MNKLKAILTEMLLEKITVTQQVKKFPAFYGTLRIIITSTKNQLIVLQKLHINRSNSFTDTEYEQHPNDTGTHS
jgi:hypothetical protein